MKKLILSLVAVAFVILIAEVASFAALSIVKKSWFNRVDTLYSQQQIIETSGLIDPRLAAKPDWMRQDILHPYIGYVYDEPTEEDQYGFRNSISPLQKRGEDKIILAVTGGSFAHQTFDTSIDLLIDELKKHEMYRQKEFVVIRLAAAGYKQPQQLMILNYFLSLGGEFDILINIDGFNEVALSSTENYTKGVFPFFPRKWLLRIDLLSDKKMLHYVMEGMKIRKQRVMAAKLFGSNILRNSYAFNFVWESIDHFLQRRKYTINEEAEKELDAASSYVASGPSRSYESDEEMFAELVDVWKRSSLQMARLSHANKIQYFHFLQPNQYHQGSKLLSEVERESAFEPSHKYRSSVVGGYPYLIAAGHELEQSNVSFEDLTGVFSANEDTLYADSCCHLNNQGYELIVQSMAKSIIAKTK